MMAVLPVFLAQHDGSVGGVGRPVLVMRVMQNSETSPAIMFLTCDDADS
jgi:hypothetical protein